MKNVGVIFFLIGIILIGLGGYIFVREQLFIQTAEQAIAVVTGNESVMYTGTDVNEMGIQQYFCSAFQFQTRDGQTISFKETQGKLNQASCANLGTLPDYEIGQDVPVYYDPRDPANSAQIPKLVKKYYSLAAAFAVAGVLLVYCWCCSGSMIAGRTKSWRRRASRKYRACTPPIQVGISL